MSRLAKLSDAECLVFRRLPLNFNDMVRAIFAAGEDRASSGKAATAAHLADRLERLADRLEGAGDVPRDLAEAARLLRAVS